LWSLSFWLSHEKPKCIYLLPMCATWNAHLILIDFIILIISFLFGTNILFSTLFPEREDFICLMCPLQVPLSNAPVNCSFTTFVLL
jgi:hypothetical protein